MKKRNLFFLSLLTVSMTASFMNKKIQSDAAFFKENEFSDNFDSLSLNEQWINNDANLVNDYYSFRLFPSKYEWVSTIANRVYKINGDFNLEFELASLSNEGWFGIVFGLGTKDTSFSYGINSLIFSNGKTIMQDTSSGNLKENGVSFDLSPFQDNEINTRRIVKISGTKNNNTYSIDYRIYEKSGALRSEELGIQFDNIDGYIGFNSMFRNIEMYNFKGTCGEFSYVDDFSKSSVLYSNKGSSDAEWGSQGFSEEEFSIGCVARLSLEKINSQVVYKNKYEKVNKDLNLLYSLNMDICLETMSIGIDTGFDISKNDINSNGIFFGLRRNSIGYSLLSIKDNKETLLTTSNEPINSKVNVTLELFSNGNAILSSNDLELITQIDIFDGYIALTSKNHSNLSGNLSGAKVDNFSYLRNSYLKRDTQDMANNFNGTKSTNFEDYVYYEFYCNSLEWYMTEGVDVAVYNNKNKDNGYISFNNSLINSSFTPRALYKDYIVRFDATIVTDLPDRGACLGLQVGKNVTSMLYENAQSVGIGHYDSTNVFSTNATIVPGYSDIISSLSGQPTYLFKQGNVINFVYVVQNDVVTMEVTSENNGDPVHFISQYKVKSSDGYVSVYGANGLSFNLDNFSITNLDYDVRDSQYAGESLYQETTRCDFTTSNTSGLNLENAELVSNSLKINENGTVSTVGLVNNNITRFKIRNVEDVLELTDNNIKIDFINNSETKIVIKNAYINETIDLDDDFVFRNSYFEIYRFESKLILSFISGNEPLEKIITNSYVFDVNKVDDNGKLSFKSISGESSLTEFSFFNINNYMSIKNRDFNPDTDTIVPWPVRDAIQDINKGCGGSILSLSILVSVISISFILFISIRKIGGNKHE